MLPINGVCLDWNIQWNLPPTSSNQIIPILSNFSSGVHNTHHNELDWSGEKQFCKLSIIAFLIKIVFDRNWKSRTRKRPDWNLWIFIEKTIIYVSISFFHNEFHQRDEINSNDWLLNILTFNHFWFHFSPPFLVLLLFLYFLL